MAETSSYPHQLRTTPVLETRYIVPGSGHGYTADLDKARSWAIHRARLTGQPAEVITYDVTIGPQRLSYVAVPPSGDPPKIVPNYFERSGG